MRYTIAQLERFFELHLQYCLWKDLAIPTANKEAQKKGGFFELPDFWASRAVHLRAPLPRDIAKVFIKWVEAEVQAAAEEKPEDG